MSAFQIAPSRAARTDFDASDLDNRAGLPRADHRPVDGLSAELINAPLTPDERHAFAREVVALARVWRLRLSERLKTIGMTPPRWAALYWLSQVEEGISQTALAELAGVEAPALVRTVDLLEEQGLVERRASPTDRRVNLVQLTEVGREAVGDIHEIADALRREVMEGLDPATVRAALDLMSTLRHRLS